MSVDRLIHRYTHTHIRQLMSYELVYTSIHSSISLHYYGHSECRVFGLHNYYGLFSGKLTLQICHRVWLYCTKAVAVTIIHREYKNIAHPSTTLQSVGDGVE